MLKDKQFDADMMVLDLRLQFNLDRTLPPSCRLSEDLFKTLAYILATKNRADEKLTLGVLEVMLRQKYKGRFLGTKLVRNSWGAGVEVQMRNNLFWGKGRFIYVHKKRYYGCSVITGAHSYVHGET